MHCARSKTDRDCFDGSHDFVFFQSAVKREGTDRLAATRNLSKHMVHSGR